MSGSGDVAARANFCTLDANGNIVDRRAGRIPNEVSIPILEKLKSVQIPGVTIEVNLVKEYRFSVVMRGEGLNCSPERYRPPDDRYPPLSSKSHRSSMLNILLNCSISGSLRLAKY